MPTAIHPVTMPKWGVEMTAGTLNLWSVAEGAHVSKGDPLLELETWSDRRSVPGELARVAEGPGEPVIGFPPQQSHTPSKR